MTDKITVTQNQLDDVFHNATAFEKNLEDAIIMVHLYYPTQLVFRFRIDPVLSATRFTLKMWLVEVLRDDLGLTCLTSIDRPESLEEFLKENLEKVIERLESKLDDMNKIMKKECPFFKAVLGEIRVYGSF